MADLNEELKNSMRIVPELFMPNMVSTNDFVIKGTRQVEIIPRELNSFGNKFNEPGLLTDALSDRLTFYVSDPQSYLDMPNSYFTADLLVQLEDNGNADILSFIDKGGVHNLFERVIVKIGGAVLARIDDHPRLYNVEHLSTHSENYTDMVLATSGDSVEDLSISTRLSFFTFAYNHGTTTVTLTGGKATSELKVNDLINVSVDGVGIRRGIITAITNDNVFLVNLTADIVNAEVMYVEVINNSTRTEICNQANNIRVQWRMPQEIFNLSKYFPLPYLQNIAPLEIEFTMSNVVKAFVLAGVAAGAANNKLGYRLSRPRLVAHMITPDDIIRSQHDELFMGEGIWFPYVNVRHFQNALNNGSTSVNYTFQTNISSARAVASVIVDRTRADGTGITAQVYPSTSSFLKGGRTEYRYQSGSLRFPEYGDVNCADIASGEAFAQLMSIFPEGAMKSGSLIRPHEWFSATSNKFIFATKLAKDDSFWSGLPLKNNFLELYLNGTDPGLDCNVHSWVWFDSALLIQKDAGCRVYE
jgi:hypothetical protein